MRKRMKDWRMIAMIDELLIFLTGCFAGAASIALLHRSIPTLLSTSLPCQLAGLLRIMRLSLLAIVFVPVMMLNRDAIPFFAAGLIAARLVATSILAVRYEKPSPRRTEECT